MKLQQLRYFCEVARQGLSISKAAAALHTSQPGVSKQLALLETELGVTVFTRNRNRISELSDALGVRGQPAIVALVQAEVRSYADAADSVKVSPR